MQTPNSKWDVERAAAWLRKHAWGASGEDSAPALDAALVAAAVQAAAAVPPVQDQGQHQDQDGDDDIDIAGWPALVAPFYD